MNFEEAVRLHKSGNNLYRKSKPDMIWRHMIGSFCFFQKYIEDIRFYFDIEDYDAPDWALYVDYKLFNLSDKLKKMVDIGDESGQIVLSCEIDDIKEFINELKESLCDGCRKIGADIDKIAG